MKLHISLFYILLIMPLSSLISSCSSFNTTPKSTIIKQSEHQNVKEDYSMEEYTQLILKIPHAKGEKERIFPKNGEIIHNRIDLEWKRDQLVNKETKEVANGIYKSYDDEGRLTGESRLLDGRFFGKYYAHRSNGTLSESMTYDKNGRINGFHIYYYDNGNIAEIIYVVNRIHIEKGLVHFKILLIQYDKEGKITYENY